MQIVKKIALILVLVGALNWGSVGLNDFNFVEYLNNISFKNKNFIRAIYILVGLSALYIIGRKTYKFITKNSLYYKHYEFHWCNDGVVGDAHCIRAGYGNKCLNNTCIVDTSLPNAPSPF